MTKYVKIIKAEDGNWYKDQIGQIYPVIKHSQKYRWYTVAHSRDIELSIAEEHCVEVSIEEVYKPGNMKIIIDNATHKKVGDLKALTMFRSLGPGHIQTWYMLTTSSTDSHVHCININTGDRESIEKEREVIPYEIGEIILKTWLETE